MANPLEHRCLIAAPSGKDSALIAGALARAGIPQQTCGSVTGLVDEIERGAAAVMLAEEALASAGPLKLLHQVVQRQPPWSDLPVVLLTRPGPPTRLAIDALAVLGNVTVLERPVPSATLVSAVRTALRTRERQYLAREADRRKDEFLATLAHELRNPLAPIANALHLLQRDDSSAQVRDWALHVMHRQVQQMTRLVDDLLDVARITQGKVALKKRLVDARDVVRNAIEISAPWIDAMGHTLHTDIADQVPTIDADPVRLAQCVSNLLNNAAKYTPKGGRIELKAHCVGGDWELTVSDDGVGIPAAAMSSLFDIFTQVDRRAGASQGGLGIGLSIVKTFVELHGGSVQAHSDGEGRGSTFVLRVPLVSHCAPAEAPPPEVLRASAGPRRILVVDDNADSADSLSLLLSACGHTVQKAYNGEDGITAALRTPPDLAILDLGLPDMTGFDVAQRLRAAPETARTVLVALSGWGQTVDRQRSAQAGFSHHLVKPADPMQVIGLIEALAP